MTGTVELLRREIMGWERGRIFFIDDFASYDSQWGVRFGLSQMAGEGFIIRLARGVYCYPRIEGEYMPTIVTPSPETIANAIATRERVRIIPYGDQAAYKLGLTGVRVSDLKYLTDGASRRICLSKGKKIYFNHTSEVKMFDFCNSEMQMVCSAIRAIGIEMIGEDGRRRIHDVIRRIPEKEFMKDLKIPPAWVQEYILDIWNS